MMHTRMLLLALSLGVLAACMADAPADRRIQEPAPLAVESPFEYPVALWDEGVEGRTVLFVHVTSEGAVDSAYVYDSSGYAAFDSAAVASADELRFAPGWRGDERVDMWVKLPVRFSLDSAALAGIGAMR